MKEAGSPVQPLKAEPLNAEQVEAGKEPGSAEHPTHVDAAQAALNRMREAARNRGEIRIAPGRKRPEAASKAGRRRRSFTDGKDSGRDPLGLGSVVNRLVSERGWSSPVAVGSVMAQWNTLVGSEIAAHCQPGSFTGTVLQVRCDSTSWATQLRLLSSSLLARFDAELGVGVVTKIQVLGPAAPNWRKGYRSVSGRGPRDTYG
jgi:predicted nucleic acid-binding Zn ribbon protein